jgi:hypothetical protein
MTPFEMLRWLILFTALNSLPNQHDVIQDPDLGSSH